MDSGIFFFVGPVLLLLSLIFLWIQNQFFPMMVCGLFAVFWLSFGLLQLPTLQIAASYAPTAASSGSTPLSMNELAAVGAATKEFNTVIALYLIVWGFAIFTFWVFAIRINVVFAGIFTLTATGSWIMSGAYWKVASGDYAAAKTLQVVRHFIHLVVVKVGKELANILVDGRSRLLHRRNAWVVCPFRYDGRRDAGERQSTCWRPEPSLEKDRRRAR